MRRVTVFLWVLLSILLCLLLSACSDGETVRVAQQPVDGVQLLLGDTLYYHAADGIYSHSMTDGAEGRVFWMDGEEELLGLSATSNGLYLVTRYAGNKYRDDAICHFFWVAEDSAVEAVLPDTVELGGEVYTVECESVRLCGEELCFTAEEGAMLSAKLRKGSGRQGKLADLNYFLLEELPERTAPSAIKLTCRERSSKEWQPTWYGEELPSRFWSASEPWHAKLDRPWYDEVHDEWRYGYWYRTIFPVQREEDYAGEYVNVSGGYTLLLKDASEESGAYYFNESGWEFWLIDSFYSLSDRNLPGMYQKLREWQSEKREQYFKGDKAAQVVLRIDGIQYDPIAGTMTLSMIGPDYGLLREELQLPDWVVFEVLDDLDIRLDEPIPREPVSEGEIKDGVFLRMTEPYLPKGSSIVWYTVTLESMDRIPFSGTASIQKYVEGAWRTIYVSHAVTAVPHYVQEGEGGWRIDEMGLPGQGLYRFSFWFDDSPGEWVEFAVE